MNSGPHIDKLVDYQTKKAQKQDPAKVRAQERETHEGELGQFLLKYKYNTADKTTGKVHAVTQKKMSAFMAYNGRMGIQWANGISTGSHQP